MKQSLTVAVVVAVMILVFSMALSSDEGIAYAPFQNQFDTTQQFTLSTPLVLGISAQPNTQLNQTTRAEINSYVQSNPGVHFRGICNGLDLSVGMVQYHIGILAYAGFLTVYSDGKMQRYFESGKFSKKEMKIISILRHKTSRNILKIVSERKAISHGELAAQLTITSQGLTWQMHSLEKAGVVEEANNGLKLIYSINKADVPLVSEFMNLVK